jgi:hypothetical protein
VVVPLAEARRGLDDVRAELAELLEVAERLTRLPRAVREPVDGVVLRDLLVVVTQDAALRDRAGRGKSGARDV